MRRYLKTVIWHSLCTARSSSIIFPRFSGPVASCLETARNMWGGVEEGTTDLEEGEYAMCEATSVSNMLTITNDYTECPTRNQQPILRP